MCPQASAISLLDRNACRNPVSARIRVVNLSDADLARLAARLGERLARLQYTVATAESCTGGWLAKAMTDVSGSSRWFHEGFVTYSNAAKERRLGVPAAVLAKHGAVSEATARAMAAGCLREADSSIAVAITGIAGPGGAVPGKPVGTVWFAWAQRRGRGLRIRTLCRRFRGDRDMVRRKAVLTALRGLLA